MDVLHGHSKSYLNKNNGQFLKSYKVGPYNWSKALAEMIPSKYSLSTPRFGTWPEWSKLQAPFCRSHETHRKKVLTTRLLGLKADQQPYSRSSSLRLVWQPTDENQAERAHLPDRLPIRNTHQDSNNLCATIQKEFYGILKPR